MSSDGTPVRERDFDGLVGAGRSVLFVYELQDRSTGKRSATRTSAGQSAAMDSGDSALDQPRRDHLVRGAKTG